MQEIIVDDSVVPENLIVAAEGYFLDRFTPSCELITLPEGKVAGGRLAWSKETFSATPPISSSRFRRALKKKTNEEDLPKDACMIDLRGHNPENWAHFLNNHLPLTFFAAQQSGIPPTQLFAILPSNTPEFIKGAADLFGLKALYTDNIVNSYGLNIEMTPWTGQRAARAKWARLDWPTQVISRLKPSAGVELPKKVFLSRRKERSIINDSEIEGFLQQEGYKTVYPEDLSPSDQILLFQNAEEMVAIHGAGLAPLLYCTPDLGLRRLIEIMPVGHMTGVFRIIANQVGCKWIGVRGRLKAKYVNSAYDLTKPHTKHSLDNFEVDPVSLRYAIDLVRKIG